MFWSSAQRLKPGPCIRYKPVTGHWINADLPWGKKKTVPTQKAAIEFWEKIGYKDYLL
jgi:hypothetical protein